MRLKEILDKMTPEQLAKLANEYISGEFQNIFFSGWAFADYLLTRKDFMEFFNEKVKLNFGCAGGYFQSLVYCRLLQRGAKKSQKNGMELNCGGLSRENETTTTKFL